MKAFFLAVPTAAFLSFVAIAQQPTEQVPASASPDPVSTASSMFSVGSYTVTIVKKATAVRPGDLYFDMVVEKVSSGGKVEGIVRAANPEPQETCRDAVHFRTENKSDGSVIVKASGECGFEWTLKRTPNDLIVGKTFSGRFFTITKKE
jgi:hypothetical protein